MPGGRPSKIHDRVTLPVFEGLGPPRQLPITDAICLLLEEGVYPANAAGACGVSPSTLSNWLRYGGEWEDTDLADVPEDRRVFVEFLERAKRAEATGLAWHERNVALAARGRDRDGRLSLEFLARRQPKVYSKRVEVKVDPVDRRPSGIDAELAGRAEETFLAAALPDDLSPDDFLPPIKADAEAEAGAEAPA